MGISWEAHGKLMGGSWEAHGRLMRSSWEAHGKLMVLMKGGPRKVFRCYLLRFEQFSILQKGKLMGGSWGRARGRLMGGSGPHFGPLRTTSDLFGPLRTTSDHTSDHFGQIRTTADHYIPPQLISCIPITAIVHSFRIHYADMYSTSLTVSELPPTMVRFTCHAFDAVGKLTRKPMIQ